MAAIGGANRDVIAHILRFGHETMRNHQGFTTIQKGNVGATAGTDTLADGNVLPVSSTAILGDCKIHLLAIILKVGPVAPVNPGGINLAIRAGSDRGKGVVDDLVVIVQGGRRRKGTIGVSMSGAHLTRVVLGKRHHPDTCNSAVQVDGKLGQILTAMGGNLSRLVVHLAGLARHPAVTGQSGNKDIAACLILGLLRPTEKYLPVRTCFQKRIRRVVLRISHRYRFNKG